MELKVEKAVLDAGVKIVFPVIKGIDNTLVPEKWMEFRTRRLKELYEEYKDLDPHEDEILEGFNILHDETGVKRRKNIPASENLIKLLKKNEGEMFFINTAVDIYNIVSMESKLALGAHNIRNVEGDFTLRFTDGTEKFVPLGQSEPVPVNPHEYSYCDDSNEVLCRLEIRQVNKTAVGDDATDVVYIIQGNKATSDEYVMKTAQRVIDLTTEYLGGTGKVVIPTIV